MIADDFSKVFRKEHRCVRDGLFELMDAFEGRDSVRAASVLQRVAACAGPHFRYEEEALYPALVSVYGADYVEKFLADHDKVIQTAGELLALVGKKELPSNDATRAKSLVQSILPHVSDCEIIGNISGL